MKRILDLTEKVFGRLTVLERAGRTKHGDSKWLCVCECGNTAIVIAGNLNSGHTRSCGCLVVAVNTTHGECKSPEHKAWEGMIKRCLDESHHAYRSYGGRGICICVEWVESFGAFLKDVGRRPSRKHTLDRYPNNNGDYVPGNVRWATMKQQGNNRRTNRLLDFNGEVITQSEYIERSGLSFGKVQYRVKTGKIRTVRKPMK